MDYVGFEAKAENGSDEELVFLEKLNDNNFIDDSIQKEAEDAPSFYRFVNQTRDVSEALNDDNITKLDIRDLQPEMFYHVKGEFVEFDKFDGYKKCSNKFKEILCLFQSDLHDSFFNAILYGLLFKFSEDNKIDGERVEQILGKEFFENFKKTRYVTAGSVT